MLIDDRYKKFLLGPFLIASLMAELRKPAPLQVVIELTNEKILNKEHLVV